MNHKIAQLILAPDKDTGRFSDIYIGEPEESLEKLAGKLFILVEMDSRTADDLKAIGFLMSELEANYYHNERLMYQDRPELIKIDHVFEAAVAKTNKSLLDFIQAEKIKFNASALNAIVGVIHGADVYFASIGKNKAFLVYKNKVSQPKAKGKAKPAVSEVRYRAVDVITETTGEGRFTPINEAKLFSSVISGSIPNSGYLVMTNEALSEYLSSNQLIDIVTALPPLSAVEQMRNVLSGVNAYVPFLGIVIKNTIGLADEARGDIAVSSATSVDQSISNLNSVEEKTEKLLSPGGYINFKKSVRKTLDSLFGKLEPVLDAPAPEKSYKKLFPLKKIQEALRHLIVLIVSPFLILFRLLSDKEKFLSFARNSALKIASLASGIRTALADAVLWFKTLSLRNKIVLFIFAGSLLAFAQNIIIKSLQNEMDKENELVAQTVKAIEQKENQIEANLLYGNDDMVRKLLSDIKEMLDKLPKSGTEQYVALFKRYNDQSEKMRHVENPVLEQVADFSKLDQNARPLNIVIAADNKVYSADPDRRNIYSYDPKSNAVTSASVKVPLETLVSPSTDKADNIYYFNNYNVLVFNTKTENMGTMAIDKIEPENIGATKVFSNKLYLVHTKEGQIYRYNRGAAGYSGGERWLDEAADFAGATTIDIDGNIYVMKENGEMLKFLKGRRAILSFDPVEPIIASPVKLTVGEEARFFYVFESDQQRLIVFDANGKFLVQYQSPQFKDLKDFAVDEKQKLIYFLDGHLLYKAQASYFNK